MPNIIGCFVSPVAYFSWIVNGFLVTTFALFCSNKCLAFAGVVGIKGSPCIFKTGTLKSCSLLPESWSTSELLEKVFKFCNTWSLWPCLITESQLLRTCGASVGVYVSLFSNFCIFSMPPNQLLRCLLPDKPLVLTSGS